MQLSITVTDAPTINRYGQDTDERWTILHIGGVRRVPPGFNAQCASTLRQDPTAETDEYKVSVEFEGTFQGQPFTLYDYKGDMQLHIGGRAGLQAARLIDTLTTLIIDAEPTPYTAILRYDDLNGQTHSYPARD